MHASMHEYTKWCMNACGHTQKVQACMWEQICASIHVRIHEHAHACMHVCINTQTCPCMHVTNTQTCACMHVKMHVNVRACMYKYTKMCMPTTKICTF